MELQVIGKSAPRAYTSEKTGNTTHYVNIYGVTAFSDFEKKNGSSGNKCITVNTSMETKGVPDVAVGDIIKVSYEPTGFKNRKTGQDEFRISEVTVLVPAGQAKAAK